MSKIVYTVVRHDGGWAYQANGTFSESFPTREAAPAAARRAAGEQTLRGETTSIEIDREFYPLNYPPMDACFRACFRQRRSG